MAEGSRMWAISLLTIMLLTSLSAAPIDINGDIKKEDVKADNDGMHSHDENVTRGGKLFGHNQFDIGNINVPGSVAGDDVSIGHKVNIDVQGHAHDYHHNEDDTVIECKEGLREMFKSIDSNKDGLIDAMELFRVCHQNNIQITKPLAVRFLTLPDKTVGFNIAKFCELLKDSPSTNIADSINFLLQLFDKAPTYLPIDTVAKVKFNLFTGLTQEAEFVHFDGTTVTLAPNTLFNPSKPIKIVIHGWTQANLVNGQVVQTNGNDYPESFNNLYKSNGLDYTVLGVNWVPYVGWPWGNEEVMTSSSTDTANTVARFLSALARDHNITGSQLHMIGQSMGTVVTSKTAKKIQEMGMKAMSRTTLLDPCPLTQAAVISKTDADFVEAIHTSSQGICSEAPLAHVDFYPNGGDAQLCGSIPCSCLDGSEVCDKCYHGKSRCLDADGVPDWLENHGRAMELYRGSIGRPTAFLSWKCSQTYQQFVDNGRWCENDEGRRMVSMGEHSLDGGRPEDGLYYLETTGEPPFYIPLLSEDPPLLLGSAPTNFEAVGTCDSGTICGHGSLEPITDDILKARKYACMLGDVEFIKPLYPNNPKNVKNVEAIFSEQKFKELFPNRNAAYTYENFLKAIGKFPSICAEATNCKKILVNMFGHFGQETAGLKYVEEIRKERYCGSQEAWALEAYPCQKGKQYYGRGSKQLTHNYNYGAFSNAMFGTPILLLNQPELVATTWLNFASGMWFFVTPQSPKPSILDVVEGRWQPNSVDKASGLVNGFGTSIRIINGGQECGSGAPHPQKAAKRAEYYKGYASKLDLDISGEQLSCASMGEFSTEGSNGAQKLYWNSPSCNAGTWQSPYNALVEGDYARCLKISLDVTKVVPPECIPQAVTPVIIPENWISSGPNKGRCGAGFKAPSGVVAECDPNSIERCCSKWGYCGDTDAHCNCDGCKKFT